jgi:hypothetical protein
MRAQACPTCGQPADPARPCPHCGAAPGDFGTELAKIEREIADLAAKDVQMQKDRTLLSRKMQAAMHRRALLANAQDERSRHVVTRPKRPGRRRPPRVPPTQRRPPQQPPGPPPRKHAEPFADVLPDPAVAAQPSPAVRPEASTRSVQNILLGLGALLLGVAAVVFAGVAISTLDDLSRTSILIAATVLMLIAPLPVARRRLTATAETIAAVGLLLVPLDGYALWTVDQGIGQLTWSTYAGLVFAVTAVVAFFYTRVTRLSAPRYATLLALQPVLPLIAYEWITGPTGWAFVLAAVAALDVLLARLLPTGLATWAGAAPGAHGGLPWAWAGPAARPTATRRPAPPPATPTRPEGAPEEPDAVVTVGGTTGPPRQRPRTSVVEDLPPSEPVGDAPPSEPVGDAPPSATFWLRDAAWALHGLAYVGALGFATYALVTIATLPATIGAAIALLLAAFVGLVGARSIGRGPVVDIAAGLATLAIIGAIGRVAAVAMPGRAMLAIATAVALTGLGVRALPAAARRGPQLASALALAVVGVVVAAAAMRAAVAPIRAATPVWAADLGVYEQRLAEAVDPVGWQLVLSALLLTIAAALALPADVRRESAVAGAALTTLSAPASLGLSWTTGPWLLLVGAVGIAAAGLYRPELRATRAHLIGGGVAGLFAAGAAATRPGPTAAILAGITVAGVLIVAAARFTATPSAPDPDANRELSDWAAGGAAFALPGATAATAVALHASTPVVLAAGVLAVSLALGYAALVQVSHREIGLPLTLGPGLGALAVTAASFRADGATVADAWVGALLLVAAILLFLSPSIDAGRRADRHWDGADLAAAAVTTALLTSLIRIASLVSPGTELVAGAAVVLVLAVGLRALPADWRRGPVLGATIGGAIVAAIAGVLALRGGLQMLGVEGRIWHGDLSDLPANPGPDAWQAPAALLLLALAAAIALPRPAAYDAAAICVGLATIGIPAALGLPWWSPILVDGAVAAGYGVAAVVARDPRAARARIAVAVAVSLHAVGAGLVRPWTTAAALLLIVLLGTTVAVLARALPPLLDPMPPAPDDTLVDLNRPRPRIPAHLAQIGGAALAGALLALPGAVASLAAGNGRSAEVVLSGALAASSIGLAAVAVARKTLAEYLPYATLGIAGGATVTAVAALPTGEPAGVYAAAAALLGVIAELLREHTARPGTDPETVRRWSPGVSGPILRQPAEVFVGPARWALRPPMGALVVAAFPGALAIAAITPALVTALVDPFQTVYRIWEGPPPVLVDPPAAADVNGTGVVAALLLTIAAALAAVGFGGRRPAQAFPVVLPGLAATLLIAPISLDMDWPAITLSALAVFTLCMLGVALTPPPPPSDRARPLRITRRVAFVIGLAAGGAGLAGSLATRPLTLFTLGGAVGVGLAAGSGGRTQIARLLGWPFAAVFAQLFVLTAGLVAGLDVHWSAFGVLAVGAILLVVPSMLPRLRRPEAIREAAAVEWSGYAAALIALALVYDSLPHVAALLAAWGAVLGVAAARPNRRAVERRILFWTAVGCEIVAWWILMNVADVALPEAYTLPFAALALLVGVLEVRERPDLGSWVAYGPALAAAFLPTLVIVVTSEDQSLRQVVLLLGAVATLVAGSMRRQRAPVIIGAVVTAIAALHALIQFGPWLVLIPVGLVLLAFGANNEKNRRDLQRLRGALNRMR